MADREYTSRLGLVKLDIADVPFGYPERVEHDQVSAQNLNIIDLSMLAQATASFYTQFFVDPSGSDANDGLSADRPFATLQKAVDLVPYMFTGRAVIKMAPGIYDQNVNVKKIYRSAPDSQGNNIALLFFSGSYKDSTLSQGATSGTFDASFSALSSSHMASLTGAGWATDELVGKFILLLSGSRTGWRYPILSNTSEVLTVGGVVDQAFTSTYTNFYSIDMRSTSFRIVEPAVVLRSNSAVADTVMLDGTSTQSTPLVSVRTVQNVESWTTGEGVVFQDVHLEQNSTTAARSVVNASEVSFALRFCHVKRSGPVNGAGSTWGIQTKCHAPTSLVCYAAFSSVDMHNAHTGNDIGVFTARVYFRFVASALRLRTWGLMAQDGGTIVPDESSFKVTGPLYSNVPRVLYTLGANISTTRSVYVEGYAGQGYGLISSPSFSRGDAFLYAQGYTNNTKISLFKNLNFGVSAFSTVSMTTLRNMNVKENLVGLWVQGGPSTNISLQSGFVMSGNLEGVKFGTLAAQYTNVQVQTGTTFVDNGGGTKDFSVDNGTTWYTLAQLQALPGAVLTASSPHVYSQIAYG